MNLDTLSPSARAQNTHFTCEYLNLVSEDPHDVADRQLAWARMGEGTAFYHGKPNAFSYVPRIFGKDTREFFANLAQTAYGIMSKVLDAYANNQEIRKLFRFDPRVEKLVSLPVLYEVALPLTRVDFMLDETTGDFHFCEFNTDSSSGMDETRNATNAVSATHPYQEFLTRHQCTNDLDELFEGWVQTFLELARGNQTLYDRPLHVGIVVCLEDPHPHIGELQTYAELFEAAGVSCSIYDARELAFDGTTLTGKHAYFGKDNAPIDAIWRFCIVVDLLKYWDEVQPLIEAVEHAAVPMIGAFNTQIVHDKQLFALLRHPKMQALFTPEERAFIADHIPETYFLDEAGLDISAIVANPHEWVLKPTDWYASINVVAGPECTPDEWKAYLEQAVQNSETSYIVQRFYPPSQTTTIPIYGNATDFEAAPTSVGNLFGAYVYAGKFAGLYVRQGPHEVIGTAREGLVAPVLWVAE